jgi:hypothetical protein
MYYKDLFITARPKTARPESRIEAKHLVRAIKKATHPYDFVCNLHRIHGGVYDPHIHITIRTNAEIVLLHRLRRFLPDWEVDYCQPAQSTLATIYYQSKHTAEYVCARIRKPAQGEAFLLHERRCALQLASGKTPPSIPTACPPHITKSSAKPIEQLRDYREKSNF